MVKNERKKENRASVLTRCTEHNANTWLKVLWCNQSGNERNGEESDDGMNNQHTLGTIDRKSSL
jgi:hypothetical protein